MQLSFHQLEKFQMYLQGLQLLTQFHHLALCAKNKTYCLDVLPCNLTPVVCVAVRSGLGVSESVNLVNI